MRARMSWFSFRTKSLTDHLCFELADSTSRRPLELRDPQRTVDVDSKCDVFRTAPSAPRARAANRAPPAGGRRASRQRPARVSSRRPARSRAARRPSAPPSTASTILDPRRERACPQLACPNLLPRVRRRDDVRVLRQYVPHDRRQDPRPLPRRRRLEGILHGPAFAKVGDDALPIPSHRERVRKRMRQSSRGRDSRASPGGDTRWSTSRRRVTAVKACSPGRFLRFRFVQGGGSRRPASLRTSTASDYSPSMMRQTVTYCDADDATCSAVKDGALSFVRADVGRLPFATGSVDVVHAGVAMHCWPSPSAAIVEVARVVPVLLSREHVHGPDVDAGGRVRCRGEGGGGAPRRGFREQRRRHRRRLTMYCAGERSAGSDRDVRTRGDVRAAAVQAVHPLPRQQVSP